MGNVQPGQVVEVNGLPYLVLGTTKTEYSVGDKVLLDCEDLSIDPATSTIGVKGLEVVGRGNGQAVDSVVGLLEHTKSHSRSRCMRCKAPPVVDVHWADGRARAWFCQKCFRPWLKEVGDWAEIVRAWYLPDGEAPKQIGDGKGIVQIRKLGEGLSSSQIADRLDRLIAQAGEGEKAYQSVIVALIPHLSIATRLAQKVEGALPLGDLHVTLAHLGKKGQLGDSRQAVENVLREISSVTPPIRYKVGGHGRFLAVEDDGTGDMSQSLDAVYASVDSPQLPELYARLVDALQAAGVEVSKDHGFTPHITLAYIKDKGWTPALKPLYGVADQLVLCWGDEQKGFQLKGPVGYVRKREQEKGMPATFEDTKGRWATLKDGRHVYVTRSTRDGGKYTGGRIRWESGKHAEASLEANGDIHVGPKFFDLGEDSRRNVLIHEMGHGILQRNGYDYWKAEEMLRKPGGEPATRGVRPGAYLHYGGNLSAEEAAADAMMSRAVDPQHLRDFSETAYRWATAQYLKAGIDPEKVLTQAGELVGQLERGPSGGKVTLVDLKGSADTSEDTKGRWVTIHGRPIFIAKAQGTPAGAGGATRFDRERWEAMDPAARRDKWESLSEAQRDDITDAANSIPDYQKSLTAHAGARPDLEGDNVGKAIDARLSSLTTRDGEAYVPEQDAKLIGSTVHDFDSVLKDAGLTPEQRYKLTMEAADALVAQDREAMGRTLGDHGIYHLKGNIDNTLGILSAHPGDVTPQDAAAAYMANIFHDTGYLAPPAQMFLDSGHPRWSQQHYDENLRPMVREAFGGRFAGNVSHLIRTHDATNIDWDNDTLGSAVRVADNVALFQSQKLPALFRHVPGSTNVIEQLSAGRIIPQQARTQLTTMLNGTGLSKSIKAQLARGIPEVGTMTGKFTLGMLGGDILGFGWGDNALTVRLGRNADADRLQKALDLGQRQFAKFAKTYGVDPERFTESLQFEFKDPGGRTLLRSTIEEMKALLKKLGVKSCTTWHTLSNGHRVVVVPLSPWG